MLDKEFEKKKKNCMGPSVITSPKSYFFTFFLSIRNHYTKNNSQQNNLVILEIMMHILKCYNAKLITELQLM